MVWFINCLPDEIFDEPVSYVIIDNREELLGAHIAEDGQWRFPASNVVPEKFAKALIYFEDKKFYTHFGVDPMALGRAFYQNISENKRVSGGSTISMQVIRLSRKGKSRNILEKIVESILATRLEMSYSKKEILSLYAANAPFGGNVVGLEAAAWRYFGRSPNNLSWAEAALLAVLPNSPALIHPGKNRELLYLKRNRLLKSLFSAGEIDEETYELSIVEEIPENPKPYPMHAPHLLASFILQNSVKPNKERIHKLNSSIDIEIQQKVNAIVNRYNERFSGNGIYNAAALVLDVETGEALAYIGNTNIPNDKEHGTHVDIIQSRRSTGSILKPFLYCGMLSSGEILPNALVPDIPVYISGYTPKNYNLGYDGAVPAKRALARSLNIPAIKLLQDFGIRKFIHLLRKAGMTTIDRNADYYGLSLVLGGCEGTLWDIAGVYASMARTLNHYSFYNSMYSDKDFHPPTIFKDFYPNQPKTTEETVPFSVFNAGAIWLTFQAMLEVERPPEKSNWESFSSSKKIAWKTGTSFGFRDGWAIGVTTDFVVAVWVGNADGEGRPKLTGITTAAPILFEIFDILPAKRNWFDVPYDDLVYAEICKHSGYLASDICEDTDSIWIPANGINFPKCPYHKLIHLDFSGKYRVHSNCESVHNMIQKPWFVLPPSIEMYYKTKNAHYKTLPPYRDDCKENLENSGKQVMEVIYPKNLTKIYIPLELDGTLGMTVFELAHKNNNATVYWHVDNNFVGETKRIHQMPLQPPPGMHILTLVDSEGNQVTVEFEILKK
ncbi:MAG: penicillin-binding protein 1C [Bacteroidales bacterium]|nr:penicillin-binding protein 1C [Bacteroidales bacterium]